MLPHDASNPARTPSPGPHPAAHPGAQATPASSQGGAAGWTGPSLAIAALDDDADFREYIRTVLEGDHHRVQTYATPAECYATFDDALPDVLLLDMNMGRFSGQEVLEEVRRRWSRLCVIVITGYPSLDTMRQTFRQDVFDYLAKPFSIADLRRTLQQAVDTLGLGQLPQDRLRAELGRQVRLARTAKSWTLKDLSESSGISVSQLSSIERGAHLPSLESLVRIAHALDEKPSRWMVAAGL